MIINSKVFFSFVPSKQFGQLINISPNTLTTMNTVNTEFSFVEVWFTNQASKALEIDISYWVVIIKMRYSIEPRFRKYVKGYGLLSFAKKFGKKLMDTATETGIDAAKTASKRIVQKTAEATGDLIGNKIAEKLLQKVNQKKKKQKK